MTKDKNPYSVLNDLFDNGDYTTLKRAGFSVVTLSPGEKREITTHTPTIIDAGTGSVRVRAFATTIIDSKTGAVDVESYAPVLLTPSTGDIRARIYENAVIIGGTSKIDLVAASDLEFMAASVRSYNGREHGWKNVHENAPAGNMGVILLQGSTGDLTFRYSERVSSTRSLSLGGILDPYILSATDV